MAVMYSRVVKGKSVFILLYNSLSNIKIQFPILN